MACIRHFGILQSIFTALEILCPPTVLSSTMQALVPIDIFIVSIGLPCPECHKMESYIMELFQIVFFHPVICILGSSISFHVLTVHVLLKPNSTPLSGCTTAFLSICLLKDVLLAS